MVAGKLHETYGKLQCAALNESKRNKRVEQEILKYGLETRNMENKKKKNGRKPVLVEMIELKGGDDRSLVVFVDEGLDRVALQNFLQREDKASVFVAFLDDHDV